MRREVEAWYRNPFRLGGLGLLLLLVGFLTLRELAAGARVSSLGMFARLTYLAGFLLMIVAGVLWFLQSQAPSEPIEDHMADDLPSTEHQHRDQDESSD